MGCYPLARAGVLTETLPVAGPPPDDTALGDLVDVVQQLLPDVTCSRDALLVAVGAMVASWRQPAGAPAPTPAPSPSPATALVPAAAPAGTAPGAAPPTTRPTGPVAASPSSSSISSSGGGVPRSGASTAPGAATPPPPPQGGAVQAAGSGKRAGDGSDSVLVPTKALNTSGVGGGGAGKAWGPQKGGGGRPGQVPTPGAGAKPATLDGCVRTFMSAVGYGAYPPPGRLGSCVCK